MLKGWFDRVWTQGLGAANLGERSKVRNIRRIVVVTTHGSSKLVSSVQGEPGKRIALRALRAMCHPLARTRWVALYGLDRSLPDDRHAFLDRVERAITRL